MNKNAQAAACMNLEITQTEKKHQQYYTDILDIFPMFLLQTYENLWQKESLVTEMKFDDVIYFVYHMTG